MGRVVREIVISAIGDGAWNYISSGIAGKCVASGGIVIGGVAAWMPDVGIAWWWRGLIFIGAISLLGAIIRVSVYCYKRWHGGEVVFPNFYSGRSEHRQYEEIKGANEIWALWRNGSNVRASSAWKEAKIEKIVLAHPVGLMIENELKFELSDKKEAKRLEIQDEIAKTVSAIKEKEIKQWVLYKGSIDYTLTFINPRSDDGFVNVEFWLPFKDQFERPGAQFSKRYNPEIFNGYVKIFDAIMFASKQD